ncbi:hypothetical protein FQA39_LY10244 [Lamprigera yunnana]|nr:hypothetical protein FQA39_LY10244 [Lamprigera yunnana]
MDNLRLYSEHWYIVLRAILRLCFILLNNMYCIPTYVVWMVLLLPLKKFHPDAYWKIEGYFFHWLLAMVSMWSWCAGYDVVEMGDDISECLNEKTLVIANHQSTADVPMLMALLNTKKQVLPNIMWIMDKHFKYTNFGIVSVLHQDFFIMAGRKSRDRSLKELVMHLFMSYIPRNRKWMVLFPEGGFLRKRKATSQRYATQNSLPVLNNVSLPRVGALQAIMQTIGPQGVANNNSEPSASKIIKVDRLSWVLDITIAYPNGEPLDLLTIILGHKQPCKTTIFYRLYRCDELPHDTEALTHWLYDRFVEKEHLLDIFYNTGVPTMGTAIPNTGTVLRTLQEAVVLRMSYGVGHRPFAFFIQMSSVPTVDISTTRRYNFSNGYNKIHPLSKLNKTVNPDAIRYALATKPNKYKNNDNELIKEFVNNNVEDLRYPNKTLKIKKTRPTNNKTKLNDSKKHHLKEDWASYNIPVPNPNPDIFTYSPTHSISSTPISTHDSDGDTASVVSSENLISQFDLDLRNNVSDCPTVHLTNSILGPSQKQECPDLNIAINTYVHDNPNAAPEKLPEAIGELDTAGSDATSQLVAPLGLADSAPSAALETLADPISPIASSPLGGSSEVLPSLPELPGFPETPDLKGVLDFIKNFGKGLEFLRGFLQGFLNFIRPLFYVIPLISFGLGFLTVLPLYPWWLPFFFIGKKKKPPTTEFIFHKHVHKPIHHNHGWTNQPQIGDAPLNSANETSEQITLDTRTPPKVKQLMKKPVKIQNEPIEHSHAGVAEPVHNVDELWEESTKKFNFYKVDSKPTTGQGISTWVLLHSQTVSPSFVTTTKSTPKPTVKQKFDNKNLTRSEIFNKITKPLFKKRPLSTTTKKPTTMSAIDINTTMRSDRPHFIKNRVEGRRSGTVGYHFCDEKTGTTSPKKKKNKNRRRRPALDKAGNGTKLASKEKPIGTQIYNYLSREIMPTVGVGLVGLMVTAGLASYFLYPFGAVRRSYDVDRKDKDGLYYYNDQYSPGGITEEEAIGKVIAGMPLKNAYSNYPSAKGGIQNRKTDDFGLRRGQAETSVEAIYLTPSRKNEDKFTRRKEIDSYNRFGQNPFNHATDKSQFYSVSEATPAVVPEHGPRTLFEATTFRSKTRKRRSNELDNEIPHGEDENKPSSVQEPNVSVAVTETPTLMNTLRMLLETQVKVGLAFLERATRAVALYFSQVNKRFNYNMNKNLRN